MICLSFSEDTETPKYRILLGILAKRNIVFMIRRGQGEDDVFISWNLFELEAHNCIDFCHVMLLECCSFNENSRKP